MHIHGLPVRDAKRKLQLHIVPADIRDAKGREPDRCAAALACVRSISKCSEAIVHIGRIYIRRGDSWERFLTPKLLAREITALDRGGTFEPGEFTLIPTSPTKQTGVKQGGPDRADRVRNRKGGKFAKRPNARVLGETPNIRRSIARQREIE